MIVDLKFSLFGRCLFGVLLAGLLAGCDSKSNSKDPDWVNEEILEQIRLIKKDIASIKNDISSLKKEPGPSKANEPVQPRKYIPPPKEVSFLGKPVMGKKSAKYMIVEFSDYECPYCTRHYKTVFANIKSKLIDTGIVGYSVINYPLAFHSKAKEAAVAARCAFRSGKFWEMHDRLFKNRKILGKEFYLKSAKELGINESRFKKCLSGPDEEKVVTEEVAYGSSISVTGTPKFFIGVKSNDKIVNVKVIGGAQGYSKFTAALTEIGAKL